MQQKDPPNAENGRPVLQLHAGDQFGPWTLVQKLGGGGNGQVWEATDGMNARVAVKILKKMKSTAYARFRDEVHTMQANKDIPGILPILDSHLPTDLTQGRPWFAMPVATPLLKHLATASSIQKVLAVADISQTLATLSFRGVSHRDIKPQNMLFWEHQFVLGDFGLVTYPNKAQLTGPKEDLGPRWTMAPEVKRLGRKADPKPADVFSLGMTLWILLTGQENGFDGQYAPTSPKVGLRRYLPKLHLGTLETILRACTDHDPNARPSMTEVSQRLKEWATVASDYTKHNPLDWIEIQQTLFPFGAPARVVWETPQEIIRVLSLLGQIDGVNHCFFPRGGGLDLEQAIPSREHDCIELITNGLANIVKPSRLHFESFERNSDWNYFRLETGPLNPSGVYADLDPEFKYEEVADIGRAFYADRSCWDYNEHEGTPLPPGSRAVSRHFEGTFAIFQKTAPYNKLRGPNDAYRGLHNKMSADEFRAYIARLITQINQTTR